MVLVCVAVGSNPVDYLAKRPETMVTENNLLSSCHNQKDKTITWKTNKQKDNMAN